MVEVRKIFLVLTAGIVAHKNKEVKNCWGIEIGTVNGVCMDNSGNKWEWGGEVKIDWSRERVFGEDCSGDCMHKWGC